MPTTYHEGQELLTTKNTKDTKKEKPMHLSENRNTPEARPVNMRPPAFFVSFGAPG
jgi:hypothetical protein